MKELKGLFFTVNYCDACRAAYQDVIEPLKKEGFNIVQMNATSVPALVKRYQIKTLPSLIFVDDRLRIVKGFANKYLTLECVKDEMKEA